VLYEHISSIFIYCIVKSEGRLPLEHGSISTLSLDNWSISYTLPVKSITLIQSHLQHSQVQGEGHHPNYVTGSEKWEHFVLATKTVFFVYLIILSLKLLLPLFI